MTTPDVWNKSSANIFSGGGAMLQSNSFGHNCFKPDGANISPTFLLPEDHLGVD